MSVSSSLADHWGESSLHPRVGPTSRRVHRVESLSSSLPAFHPPRAVVVDLCKDAAIEEIDAYVKRSGRNRFDAWMTKWTFQHVLLKRAYTRNDFVRMSKQSRFGSCDVRASAIGFEVQFRKGAAGNDWQLALPTDWR